MSTHCSLTVDAVTKRFSGAPLFAPLSFKATSGEIIAIIGSNGSGKSTLLKILANLLQPTKGSVAYTLGGNEMSPEIFQQQIGFVAPYLELYSELTAIEHIRFVAELKGNAIDDMSCVAMLSSLGLDSDIAKSNRFVKQYSSGMQQRVKTAMALALSPSIIFLDEPSSNLDLAGIELLFTAIKKAAANGALVILATNDPNEAALATRTIPLEAYQSRSN